MKKIIFVALNCIVFVTFGQKDIASGNSRRVFQERHKVLQTSIQNLRNNAAISRNVQYKIEDKGAEGVFTYDSTDVTSADNSGTVIVSKDGKRLKRVYTGPVHACWFGVKGDYNVATNEGTDDNVILNFIFKNFSDIFIDDGYYLIGKPVWANDFISGKLRAIRIVCGKKAKFTIKDGFPTGGVPNNDMFWFQHKSAVTWVGGEFNGRRLSFKPAIDFSKKLADKNAINFISTSECDNVVISGAYGYDSPAAYWGSSDGNNITIRNTRVVRAYSGAMGTLRCTNVLFENNWIRGTGPGGRDITGGIGILVTKGKGATIKNNYIDSTGDTGTKTEGTDDVVYEGNTVKHSGKDGIKVQGYTGYSNRVNNAKIINNHVDSLTYGKYDGSSLINVLGVSNFVVSGNILIGGNKYYTSHGGEQAIRLQPYVQDPKWYNQKGEISNNSILNASEAALIITGAKDILIKNNIVRTWRHGNGGQKFLDLTNDENITVLNNTFHADSIRNSAGIGLGANWRNFSFIGNKFINAMYGFRIAVNRANAGTLIIKNNYFDSIGAQIISISAAHAAGDTLELADFSNNIIRHVNMTTNKYPPYYLDLTNLHIKNLDISNNDIIDNGKFPIKGPAQIINGTVDVLNLNDFKWKSSNKINLIISTNYGRIIGQKI